LICCVLFTNVVTYSNHKKLPNIHISHIYTIPYHTIPYHTIPSGPPWPRFARTNVEANSDPLSMPYRNGKGWGVYPDVSDALLL